MRGLLRKDLYVLLRTRWYTVLTIVVMVVTPAGLASALMMAALLPYVAFSCDRESKWPELAAMMPYSPRDTVLSRYLLGWGAIAGTILLSAPFRLLVWPPLFPELGTMRELILSGSLSAMILALVMPLLFRFGGHPMLLVPIFVIAMGCLLYFYLFISDVTPGSDGYMIFKLLPYLAVGITAVSVPMSLRICRDHPIPEP